MTKWVYSFREGEADGAASQKDLLGGKGANLAEMANLGLPVPPGFTITTEVCTHFYANGKSFPADLTAQVDAALAHVGEVAGHAFNDPVWPLLVAVRSGARASMPGMMDTVLNLGLNDATVGALARISGSERFAYDCYRRFIEMYSTVVLGVEHDAFEEALDAYQGSTRDHPRRAAHGAGLARDRRSTTRPSSRPTRARAFRKIRASNYGGRSRRCSLLG